MTTPAIENPNPIIANRIITPDGTMIESVSVHDFVCHTDANGHTYCVDGGREYLGRSGPEKADLKATEASIYADAGHDVIRDVLKWGSRGKSGDQPVTYLVLSQMETTHIEAILRTQSHMGAHLRKSFEDELRFRSASSH